MGILPHSNALLRLAVHLRRTFRTKEGGQENHATHSQRGERTIIRPTSKGERTIMRLTPKGEKGQLSNPLPKRRGVKTLTFSQKDYMPVIEISKASFVIPESLLSV